ncbi:MAG: ABC transporter permease [Christensenellaceae bacterium]|nr:ABC transporter permease [Christensenellaceae bacterium]
MLAYLIRRLLILLPMLLVISFLVYLGMEMMPGDAVSYMVSPDQLANISPERLEEMREALGLNRPFVERYVHWLAALLRGNFGYSLTSGVPIAQILAQKLPATLELSAAALLISTILGNLLGILSAVRRGGKADNLLTVLGMVGVSIPEFFFGLTMLLVFSIHLKWLPIGGRTSPDYTGYAQQLRHLILPATVLGISMTAGVMRYARASMLDAMNKEFMKTARSKGLPNWRVYLMHGFRVALTPVVVLIGFRLPMLIGGSVVIEQIFQWPGIGEAFVAAVRGQNHPLVMAIALLSVIVVLVASFLVDLLTALIDPRVRLE